MSGLLNINELETRRSVANRRGCSLHHRYHLSELSASDDIPWWRYPWTHDWDDDTFEEMSARQLQPKILLSEA